MEQDQNGFFLIQKEPGETSSFIVQSLKRKLKATKLGHTGTLDKFAEGLLILPSNKATTFSEVFLEMDKTYEATLAIGKSTDSGDPEGNILSEISQQELERVWKDDWANGEVLRREILNLTELERQEAPQVSALKYKGKRLSDYHRSGVIVPPKIRKIRIYSVQILDFSVNEVRFSITVSSGTYIRKIAMDIGETLGIGMSLKKLVRTSVGKWKLEQAKTWEKTEWKDIYLPENFLDFPTIRIEKDWEIRDISMGRKPIISQKDLDILPDSGRFVLLDGRNQLLAWCEKKNQSEWVYIRVFL
jgi:tRNA pseudouridine55 synthase